MIKDAWDQIIVLTIRNDSDTYELRKTLQHNFLTLDDFKEKVIANDEERSMLFEAGRLYGTMELSSRICYEKEKDSQIYETGLSICGIKHFDEIIRLLDSRKELTQSEMCLILKMKPSALSECLKRILATDMIASRRSGKYKVYSLSDDGLRYARMLSREKQRENKKWISIIKEQFNNEDPFNLVGFELEKAFESNSKTSKASSENRIRIKDCYFHNIPQNEKYETDEIEKTTIKRKAVIYG